MICEDLIPIILALIIVAFWSANVALSAPILGFIGRFVGKTLIAIGVEKAVRSAVGAVVDLNLVECDKRGNCTTTNLL